MYLPLTGYKEEKPTKQKMSINSIGAPPTSQAVTPTNKAEKPTDNNQDVQAVEETGPKEDSSISPRGEEEFYSAASSMSTQDFIILRASSADKTLEVLDEVIENMKEKVEEMGEVIETMAKISEKANKDNLALSVMVKTFEAIDEITGKDDA